jgi:AraC-like DNA-binding protein
MLNIRPKVLDRLASDAAGRNIETFYFSKPVVKGYPVFRSLLNLHWKLEQKASPLEQESQFISVITSLLVQQFKYPKLQPLGKESHRVKLLRDYIKSRYAENISLTELSSVANLSPFHLLRVFRNQVGIPPHEYQIHMRINEARNLLRNGHSIAETALKVGFFDQSHFSRNFKRITGMTPGYYLSYSK